MTKRSKKIIVFPKQKPRTDLGSEYLRQHTQVTVDGEGSKRRARNKIQCPLDCYKVHGYIQEHQFQAGDQLYRDYYRTGMVKPLTCDLNRVSFSSMSYSQIQNDAYIRYKEAIRTLPFILGNLVFGVCVMGEYVSDLNKTLSKNVLHSDMGQLREALNILAKHYGLRPIK